MSKNTDVDHLMSIELKSTVPGSDGANDDVYDSVEPTPMVSARSRKDPHLGFECMRRDKALFVFERENPIGRFFVDVIEHPAFDGVIIFFILLSTVIMAMDTPAVYPEGSTGKDVFN